MDEHNATHVPYRDWRPHCVRSRGLNAPHTPQGVDRDGGERIPTIAIDYGPLKSEEVEDSEQMGPMLAMKDIKHGMVRSIVVPAKGTATEWVIEKCVEWIIERGHGRIILKSDQGKSVAALSEEIKRFKHAARDDMDAIIEHSDVGESQSNAAVERAVRTAEEMVRALKLALEDRIQDKLKPLDAVAAWMVDHAGYAYSRYQVGADGRTAYERWKGKRTKRPICDFAEKVLYLPLRGARGGKPDAKFHYTRSPLQDSRLFGPRPWKILATTYEKNDF